jgi:Planctomycete cytochrome C
MSLPYSSLGSLLLLGGLLAATGCGDEIDDRPATREYIVAAILAPSCGNAACHSSTAKVEGYAFDTQEAAAEALEQLVLPGDVQRSRLAQVLRATGESRMPLDSPLPEADIKLIEAWILGGAE